MRRNLPGDRGLSTLFLILLLAVSTTGFVGLKLKLDAVPRAKVPGASVIYVPSGRALQLASFGYQSILADIVYLWAIQYYSDTAVPDRYRNLDHIFGIISELDPRYEDPYLTGALIAVYEARDFDLAFKILDRGMQKNPEEWLFPFEAGHYAQLFKKDFDLARKYYERAMRLPGAPAITRRLYANAAFRSQDLSTAWSTWLDVYQTAADERIKKIASNHLYQVKSVLDINRIKDAVRKYRERFGRLPMNAGQLVRSGFLTSLPRDLDGQEYLYDPRTGEVAAATIPWKR
jgi:tetratricopeptide (TPR) repeat protein